MFEEAMGVRLPRLDSAFHQASPQLSTPNSTRQMVLLSDISVQDLSDEIFGLV